MLNIPKKLSIVLLKNLSGGNNRDLYRLSNNGKILVETPPVSVKSNSRALRASQSCHRLKLLTQEFNTKTEEVVIDNEFRIRVNFNGRYYRCYSSQVCIELIHDSFSKLNYQPYILLNYYTFLKILKSCNGVMKEGGELPGTWKLVTYSTGSYYNYDFISTDYNNLSNVEKISIQIGENHYDNGRTTVWKPGHLYYNSSGLFVYLGDAKDVPILTRRYYNYSTSFFSIFDVDDYTPITKSSKLILNISADYFNTILNYKGESTDKIFDIFRELIKDLGGVLRDCSYSYGSLLCFTGLIKTPYAIDLGEFLKPTLIGNELLNYFAEKLSNESDLILGKSDSIYYLKFLHRYTKKTFENYKDKYLKDLTRNFQTFKSVSKDIITKRSPSITNITGINILNLLKDINFDLNNLGASIKSSIPYYRLTRFEDGCKDISNMLYSKDSVIGKIGENEIIKLLDLTAG